MSLLDVVKRCWGGKFSKPCCEMQKLTPLSQWQPSVKLKRLGWCIVICNSAFLTLYEDWHAECAACHTQARNQLGTPGVAKSFLRGAHIFQTMSNSFQLCPTDFSRGGKKFCRRGFATPATPPGCGPGHTASIGSHQVIMGALPHRR